MGCPFSVVESRWWSTGNHSVRALFEAVAAIHYDNPTCFFYDMFADKSSLSTVMSMRGADHQTEVVYLATHGDENSIGPTTTNSVSRTEVRNILTAANKKGKIKGLFLGTCMTGNLDVAKFFLDGTNTKLCWLAGYRKKVDWIDGSAIDMIFFSKLAELYVANKKKKKGKLSAIQMAHQAATELTELVPGAVSTYGFNLFMYENKKLTSMLAK